MADVQISLRLLRHIVVALAFVTCCLQNAAADEALQLDADNGLSRSDKVLLLNATLAATVLTWGYFNWEYGEKSPHHVSEGWFGKNTPEGGADKLGHMYTAYVATHGSASLYRRWGYPRPKASLYGAMTSLMFTTMMEVGDAFSDYGFSYEDMIMNAAGVTAGYVLYRYPDLRRKIDLRIEYIPDFDDPEIDFTTDYENAKYLVAFKADGFDSLEDTWLKYCELQFGYYARGYADFVPGVVDNRKRVAYVAIGINVTRLLRPIWRTRLFNYLQLPYTYIPYEKEL